MAARRALVALAALAMAASSPVAVPAADAQQAPTIESTVEKFSGFGEYVPVDPVRVLDTRDGTGGVAVGRATASQPVIAGVGSVVTGPWAVAVNITVIDPSADGYLTAYAAGANVPATSNVNFVAGQTVANLAVVGVFGGTSVALQINTGTAHVAVDVVGYVLGGSDDQGARLQGVAPRRVLDTRTSAPLRANATLDLAGLPQDARAVALNVTATEGTAPSYLTLYAADATLPNASSVTVQPGVTRPNLVFARVSEDGWVRIYNYAGEVDVVVDLVGVFTDPADDDTGLTGRILPRGTPYRGFDTRTNGTGLPLGADAKLSVNYGGLDREVGADVQAVVMNVTTTEGSADSYLGVYPATGTQGAGGPPNASVLNWRAGEVNPNLAIVTLGGVPDDDERYVGIYNYAGIVQVVLDEFAYVLA